MPDIAADTSSRSTALMATTQLTSTTTTTTTIPPKPSPILCEDWQRATPARWISRQGRWLQQCVRKTAEEMGISCSSNQRLSWNETGKTWRCRSLTPYEQADRDCAESPRININGERSNHNSEGKCLMLVCDRPKGRTSGYISNYACVSRAWDSHQDSYSHDRSSKITETEARAMEFQSASEHHQGSKQEILPLRVSIAHINFSYNRIRRHRLLLPCKLRVTSFIPSA